MNQLLLDLGPPPAPTFDNVVAGRNVEALAALRRLCAGPIDDPSDRCLYLWGEPGSGRSHLLQAACTETGGTYLVGPHAAVALRASIDAAATDLGLARWLVALDDVDAADPDTQEMLFHAINAMRQDPRAAIVVAGNAAPKDLVLAAGRDDLRSRLGWGLAFELHSLDDAEKDAALASRADAMGFPLTPDVRRYLLTHFSRDLGSLMQTVDALDRHAREQRRVVTVPMIRAWSQRDLAESGRLDHAA
jgi:DnaA family protein